MAIRVALQGYDAERAQMTASSSPPGMTPTVGRPAGMSFFFGAHLALLGIVLIGFSPTFYLGSLFERRPLPGLLIMHGAVLTTWFILTVLQASLIAMRRVVWHQKAGYVVASWAVLVFALGLAADMQMASQITSPQDSDLIVVFGNLFSLVSFSACVTLAVVFRRRPELHKRLVLLASISIIGPATARFTEWPIFPGGMEARPVYGVGGLLLLYVCLLVYDVIVRRRPHPATWISMLATIVSLALAVFLAVSGAGFAILHGGAVA